jgi:threonine/homoserine/homoserine lactone efflux protein
MVMLGFVIGLTGALVPGPTLVATINASLKGGWSAGPRVTLGHAAVELLMVLLIIAGLSVAIGEYSWIIAVIGGIALLVFGVMTIREARNARIDFTETAETARPFLAGIITSISNPFFWIWWFTVGSALLIGAYSGGVVLALAFILGHWAADLGWFTLVAVSVNRGSFILSERAYRWILGVCGGFLILFGAYYLSGVFSSSDSH